MALVTQLLILWVTEVAYGNNKPFGDALGYSSPRPKSSPL